MTVPTPPRFGERDGVFPLMAWPIPLPITTRRHMKVAITLELDDDQRIAVGLLETGRMVAASRAEARSYVTEITMASINTATKIVKEEQARTNKLIRESLGMEEL
jgi:hypothetical protein